MKHQIIAELRALIDHAGEVAGGKEMPLASEAAELAAMRSRAHDADELDALEEAILIRGDEILGDPIATEADPVQGGPVYIYDRDKERKAAEYAAIARGEATPLDLFHEQFVGQSKNKARTKGDDRRALKFLRSWCEKNRVSATLQAVTRKRAAMFVDDLPSETGGLSPATIAKYVNRLSQYWQWLVTRQHAEQDVWEKLAPKRPQENDEDRERAFTDAEVTKLLNGPATQQMHDLMRIGALTGARLDAIISLRVKDCADGLFEFKPQKKETKRRAVPTHSALKEIVERRCHSKQPDESIFPEWPAPKKAGTQREHSFKASNDFTKYRRRVEVDEKMPGKRRSLVNFHSFRRWFITKAERADQQESIIAVVVGHKRKGITLGRYSAGPLMEQAQRCVEAVNLPK